MSGFVAVWVPVGASDNQDIRVAPSTEAKKEGELTLKATEAYDSQLIYEGFSNFQTIPDGSDPSVYTNRKIAENVDLFKSWGVTSFEMAPQFVSADDGVRTINTVLKKIYVMLLKHFIRLVFKQSLTGFQTKFTNCQVKKL